MSSFDMLADDDFKPRNDDWVLQASRMRRGARSNRDLTDRRGEFLQAHGIQNANRMGQGKARVHRCTSHVGLQLHTVSRSMEEALAGFPRYSARLLLHFRLLTPLLTRDDDPGYLFDNPARKDHIFGEPYLAAASLKGLSADAYQRAFPGKRPWDELGGEGAKAHDRVRAFRMADPHAMRLFGIADDGGETLRDSVAGRLHFSPVWFQALQLLVMNPGDARNAIGTLPIQFEAVAANQPGVLEVMYFNPLGSAASDEAAVRADLARWLAAVATWWPALGLGAKRLAGYGAIGIERVELQAVGWSGMTAQENKSAQAGAVESPPSYYRDYLDENGRPLSEEALQAGLAGRVQQKDTEIQKLDEAWRTAQGKAVKRAKKALDKAKNQRDALEQDSKAEHRKVIEYWEKHGQAEITDAVSVSSAPVLESRTGTGEDSWMKMARWIAGEAQ